MDKLATEVAEGEFDRFLEANDIDTEGMTDEEQASFAALKRRIVRAIQKGKLEVDEAGVPTLVSPSDGKGDIRIPRPKVAELLTSDKVRGGVARVVAMLAAGNECDPKRFASLPSPEFKLCDAVLTLFLA